MYHLTTAILAGALVASFAQGTARDDAINIAKAALARERGVAVEEVQLVDATSTQWRDSSLGCPERGVVYTPALVPGFNLILTAGSSRYSVHVGAGRAVICGDAGRPTGRDLKLPARDQTEGLRLAEQARSDLAALLKVPKERVAINFFRPTVWPDASLGCPQRGKTYAQRETRGYLIELEHAGTIQEYHSDQTQVVTCARPESAGL